MAPSKSQLPVHAAGFDSAVQTPPAIWVNRLPIPPRLRRLLAPTSLIALACLAALYCLSRHYPDTLPLWHKPDASTHPGALVPSHLYDSPTPTVRVPEEYASYLPAPVYIPDDELASRLSHLLARPVQNHDEAVESNYVSCPTQVANELVNSCQLRDNAGQWRNISKDDIRQRRAEVVTRLHDKYAAGVQVLGHQGGVYTGKGRE